MDSGTPNRLAVSLRPEAGSQPSQTENSRISMPCQKWGRSPSTEVAMMPRAQRPVAMRAGHQAGSGIPMVQVRTMATYTSSNVDGMRQWISEMAGDAVDERVAQVAMQERAREVAVLLPYRQVQAQARDHGSECASGAGLGADQQRSIGSPTAYTAKTTTTETASRDEQALYEPQQDEQRPRYGFLGGLRKTGQPSLNRPVR